MVNERIDSLAWLRKRIEQADTDLLREMVKTMAEALMSAEEGNGAKSWRKCYTGTM